jgi:hypothetical protein
LFQVWDAATFEKKAEFDNLYGKVTFFNHAAAFSMVSCVPLFPVVAACSCPCVARLLLIHRLKRTVSLTSSFAVSRCPVDRCRDSIQRGTDCFLTQAKTCTAAALAGKLSLSVLRRSTLVLHRSLSFALLARCRSVKLIRKRTQNFLIL